MCAALAFIGGILFAGSFVDILPGVIATVVIITAALFFFLKDRRKRVTAVILATAFVIGFVYTALFIGEAVEIDESDAVVTAEVALVLRPGRAVIKNLCVNSEKLPESAMLILNSNEKDEDDRSVYSEYIPGQTLTITGARVFTPYQRTFPYGFDYGEYALTYGAKLCVSAKDADVSASGSHSFIMGNAQRARTAISRRIDALFPENSAIVNALLLGIRDEVDPKLTDNFRKSGVLHVLALSGLHATMVAMMLMFCIGKLPLSFSARRTISVIVLAAYCFITGLTPSMNRAVLMAAFIYGGNISHRQSDTMTSLSLSALIILLVNPTVALYSVGFQLSFMAVAGIAVLYRPLLKLTRDEDNKIFQAVALTTAAQLGVIPILMYQFHDLSLISIVANVFVVPMSNIALALSMTSVLLSYILPQSFVQPFASVAAFAYKAMCYVADMFAALPFATIKVHSPSLAVFLLYYSALLLRIDKKKRDTTAKILLITCAVATFMLRPLIEQPKDFQMTSYDVGYGEATLLRKNGSAVLIDCGEEDAGLYHAIAGGGITIDAFVLTHGHSDHGGGLKKLVEYAKVNSIILWHGADFDQYSEGVVDSLAYAAQMGVPLIAVGSGDVVTVGEIELKILSPVYRAKNENDNSLMILASSGENSVMLTGDAGFTSEVYVKEKADVLSVGHHGGNTSTSSEFLEKLGAKLAVISVNRNNYGHPSEDVLSRLREGNLEIVTTMDNGTLTVTFSKDGLLIDPYFGKEAVKR